MNLMRSEKHDAVLLMQLNVYHQKTNLQLTKLKHVILF